MSTQWIFVFAVSCLGLVGPTSSGKKESLCDQVSIRNDPFLWSVRGDAGAPSSHLFGTIHVPWHLVRSGASLARETMRQASAVFFELDLADPDTVARLAHCQMMPEGQNLSSVLPSDLYSRLKRHLDYVRSQMSQWTGQSADDAVWRALVGDWERKRPVWVMLLVNSLTEGEVRSRGVPVLDLWLAQEAARMRKRTAAVERVEEQCQPLNELDSQQVLFALNRTLASVEQGAGTDDLVHHYNCGDLMAPEPLWPPGAPLSAPERRLADQMRSYFRRELVLKRNKRMGQRVARLIREHPGESLFFAFGAGHFLGNDTVLDFMKAEGFQIEHAKLPRSKMKKSIPDDTRRNSGTGTQARVGPSTEVPLFNDLWVRLTTGSPTSVDRLTHIPTHQQLPHNQQIIDRSSNLAQLMSPMKMMLLIIPTMLTRWFSHSLTGVT